MAKTVPLPEGVIQDPATKKVQCTLCHSRDPHSKGGSWMHKGSMGGHLQSEYHKTQALRLAEEVEREERQAQKVRDTYTQPSVQPNATFQNPSHQSRPEMFAPDLPPMDVDTGFNYNPHESFISVDMGIPLPDSRESIEEALKDQFALLMEQAEYRALFGDGDDDENDITVSDLSDHLRRTGFGSEDDNIGVSESDNTSGDPAYAPYPNQTSMFLDLLDNLPRLRISSAQLRFLLFILRSLGVKNTPSYDAFRKMQKELNDKCGNPTTAHTSTLGNKFYVNDIRQTVSRTISNPELAPHLQFYPEETEDGSVSEVWQARRWQEFDPSDCTPMYSTGLRQFFINEVSQLSDDRLVIAQDWVIRKGKLTAACRIVSLTSEGWRISNALDIIPATSFRYTAPELDAILSAHVWADPNAAPPSINPLRELAGGEDLYTVFEPIWSDDVSGNKSKQYNKHMNFYGSCANLPGQLLQQEFCVDFISTSPNASTAEQFSAIRDQIKDTHKNPIRCYNAATHRWCRIRIMIPSLPADNPQQSEESSHIGGNGNLKCRKCKMGGNYEYAESNEGFHAYHYAGILRTAKETRDELYKQLETATHGVKKAVADRQKETGVKDKVAQYWIDILLAKCSEMRKENPQRTLEEVSAELMEWLDKQPGDKVNPLLDLAGLDPTQDTPVEILHTILLGIIKYVWHMLHTSWSDADQALFAIRLQSTDLDGLTVPPIRAAYMMQYRKSLIGKHFKTLMQTMPFHVHDICTPEQFQLVQAVGALGSVLWVGEIKDMETYLADLEVLIGNVLDAFDAVDPSKMIAKIKLHLLPHLIQDIRRFGPAVRNSTEIYECYNAIFRLCSILSNHQAPSRDISIKFSSIAASSIYLPADTGWKTDCLFRLAGESSRFSKLTLWFSDTWVGFLRSRSYRVSFGLSLKLRKSAMSGLIHLPV
ncbi:hypothetical protein BDZ89DRAFT_778528 [Hymenopellis radicata]|nr:hypothetical protein BDZ89DRAFT_778528 [Hymenopellis radicata]